MALCKDNNFESYLEIRGEKVKLFMRKLYINTTSKINIKKIPIYI